MSHRGEASLLPGRSGSGIEGQVSGAGQHGPGGGSASGGAL